ncbi:hypothetical protein BC830DRAFT_1139488 [Chytriomyces sp. MP71]|nr:hypothetical protein BC830DRAFT_1139488 [Chytriomyces sp. MP71]
MWKPRLDGRSLDTLRDLPEMMQLRVLLWVESLSHIRSPLATLSQTILCPVLFMSLVALLQSLDKKTQNDKVQNALNSTPEEHALPGLSICTPARDRGCVTVLWALPTYYYWAQSDESVYNASLYEGIMREFETLNNARLKEDGEDILHIGTQMQNLSYVPDRPIGIAQCLGHQSFVYNYTLQNPNTTEFAVLFEASDYDVLNVEYTIWHNASTANNVDGVSVFGERVMSLMRGLDEAIVSYLNRNTSKKASFNATLRDWPAVASNIISDSVVQSVGPAFSFCTMISIFLTTLQKRTFEKQSQIRASLTLAGLTPLVSTTAHTFTTLPLIIANACVTTSLGTLFRFEAFTRTSPAILFLGFVSYGSAMDALAVFLAAFIETSETGVLVGTGVLALGLLMQTFIFSDATYGYIWWSKSGGDSWKYFILLPFFNFGKLFLDINTFTIGKKNFVTGGFVPGPGLPFTSFGSPVPDNLLPVYWHGEIPRPPSPLNSIFYLWMNATLFLVTSILWEYRIAIYRILPTTQHRKACSEAIRGPESTGTMLTSAPNVFMSKDQEPEELISVRDLRKEFWNGWWPCRQKITAVDGLNLKILAGEVFAILGKSGAGKTTTANILTRQEVLTSGSVLLNLPKPLHRSIGVCSQQDILFSHLTAREHLTLFAGIKGVPTPGLEALSKVNLESVADRRTGTFSGGMRRRLSLALSALGTPRVLFLDEPTTGLDPCNRAVVWRTIEDLKRRGCAVVLTTHNMEEADVLADRVGIMKGGRMVVVGTPRELKQAYGGRGGYRVSVVVSEDEGAVENLKRDIAELNGCHAVVENESTESIVFRLSGGVNDFLTDLSLLVEYLERSQGDECVKAWGVSPTTLEDVFLQNAV